ncbi:MAG: HAD-IB family hydrolase [Allobranchiibius sp.]
MASHEKHQARPVHAADRNGDNDLPGVAVYVDLDNTVIDGSALFHVGRALAAQGLLERGVLMRMAAHHAVYRIAGERPRLIDAARERSLGLAAQLRVDDVLDSVTQMYDEILAPRLSTGMVARLDAHRRAGAHVWLATAAPVELAELIAFRLGLSGALGTRAEVVDGAWTSRLDGQLLHGQAKACAVTDHAVEHGWDLADCVAYSDSLQDMPLLSAVGHPCAVNPERSLRLIAQRRGWPVLQFRDGQARRRMRVARRSS